MSAPLQLGHIIQVQLPDLVKDLGRVVWIEPGEMQERFAYIEFPESQPLKGSKARRRNHIKAPVMGCISTLLKSLADGHISLVMEAQRSERLLTDAELIGSNAQVGLLRPTRRDLQAWKRRRDKDLALIAPVLKRYTTDQLFGQNLLGKAARHHAKRLVAQAKREPVLAGANANESKQADPPQEGAGDSGPWAGLNATALRVEQVLRRYFLRGATPNALLPEYFNSGGPGMVKFCSTRTGRPNKTGVARAPRTETRLKKLQLGYRRHKRKGVSDEAAFIATLNDMWAATITYTGPGEASVTLVPESERPTLAEFIRAGRSLGMDSLPEKFKAGDVAFASKYRPRRGTARDGIHALGQVGVIDATSEDYTPVSTSSRLLLLPTPWRTMICDGFTGYIFGLHRGFEHGGTSAGLSALYHAERDKGEWADSEEIHLEKGEWLSMAFKTVRGDHGDLKSERGIATLSASEMSLEITRSYTPQLKSIEPIHQKLHVASDHRLPGTSFGEMRKRGTRPADEYLTFREGWPPLVRAICFHNNHELVPELLSLEMQRARIKPTRRAMVEYCLAEGLVVSQPTNLDYLRAACLPVLAGQGHRDRIEVWDPRVSKGTRKVPSMRFFGEFMNAPNWQLRPIKDVEIRMNTSRIGEAYINFHGLQRLTLLHHDHERHTLTLADWLFISDAQNLAQFLAAGSLQEVKASIHRSNEMGFAAAKAEKEAQLASGEMRLGGRRRSSGKKREALESEAALLKQHSLGLAPRAVIPLPSLSKEAVTEWIPATSLPPPPDDDDDDLMNNLRKQLE
jgi:hypothetical protein